MVCIGEAVDRMKYGDKVARAGWNGKGMFLYYVPANILHAPTLAKKEWGEDALVPYQPYRDENSAGHGGSVVMLADGPAGPGLRDRALKIQRRPAMSTASSTTRPAGDRRRRVLLAPTQRTQRGDRRKAEADGHEPEAGDGESGAGAEGHQLELSLTDALSEAAYWNMRCWAQGMRRKVPACQ